MRLPVITGLIRRRVLVNFAADPGVVQALLPSPLRPKLARGRAVVGICLIRLEEVRPAHVPAVLGVSSENAAHRIAVEWTDEDGTAREGVYIPRRDTDSLLNHLAGGRVFPGEHHRSRFDVKDDGETINLHMRASDGGAEVALDAHRTDSFRSSLFATLDEASEYFRRGSLGYSERSEGDVLDAITLETDRWEVAPLAVDAVRSSFFEERARFPEGSLTFDCALLMRDVPHSWHSEPDLPVRSRAREHSAPCALGE
jgi:uncharacterized protein YqjF (DUF2071 family)